MPVRSSPRPVLTAARPQPKISSARRGFPSQYRKVRERASFAFAMVSLAAAVQVTDGVVTDVRLALGGVAHKPWRARTAEEALRGGRADEAAFRAAADAELAMATPLPDNGYKIPLARNLMVATLLELTGGAR